MLHSALGHNFDVFTHLSLSPEPLLKKGATLGLSHGFLLGHLVSVCAVELLVDASLTT
jgi:hypothetical protein